MSGGIPEWIREALSKEQLKPLVSEKSNICVSAGAGSGKTRTLVHSLAYDIISGVPPPAIVAFTFTEKAADELLARIYTLLQEHDGDAHLEGMYIGTIHAWCQSYLLDQDQFYNFDIIDDLHIDALVSRLYDDLGLERVYEKPYPRGIEQFLKDLEIFYNEHLSFNELPERISPAIELFIRTLQENRMLTFGDMIRHATNHLEDHGPIKNLSCLYVDEYQDVNPAQVRLIKVMLPPTGKLKVVGDDLQCIYNWRGSDVRRIIAFEEDFSASATFRLQTNHRARPSLLHFANHIADNISLRDKEKRLKESRKAASSRCVSWISNITETEQAHTVAEIITNLIANGVPCNKIAILLRSVFGAGQPLLNELTSRGIPVDCPPLSRGGGFIQTFLIPVFNWLGQVHNEPRSPEEEKEQIEANQELWEVCTRWIPDYPGAEDNFWDGLHNWLDKIEKQHNSAYDVRGRLYDFLDQCHVQAKPEDRGLLLGLGIGSQIIRSIEEIHRRRLQGHQRRTPRGIVKEAFFALVRNLETFGESVPLDTSVNAVVLSTVHQAKGLEWPVVILPMLMPRRFPVRSRPHGTSFQDEIAYRYGTSIEDEWRLFYVAVTRARERLFLLDTAGNNVEKTSPFLKILNSKKILNPENILPRSNSIWQIAPEDIQTAERPLVRVGLSDLLLHVECPYQYALRRIVCIQPSISDELGYGRSLHEIIQRRCDAKKRWSPQECDSQVEQHLHLPYMSAQEVDTAKAAIRERIVTLDRLNAFDGKIFSEIRLDQPLSGGLVHGMVDCIQQQEGNNLVLRDWKTNIHNELLPRHVRQLQFYTYALDRRGISIKQAELVDVGASKEQLKFVTFDVDISADVVAKSVKEASAALQEIYHRQFLPKPSCTACSCCDMFRICALRKENEKTIGHV